MLKYKPRFVVQITHYLPLPTTQVMALNKTKLSYSEQFMSLRINARY